MVERAEKAGFGVALVGHAALFALLSLRLLTPKLPEPPPQQAIEVSLAPDIALEQASPAPASPAASEAPEQGPPEEEAVPQPAPKPVPAPAKAQSAPKPAPAKPARADPDRLDAVVADAERADAERAEKAAAKAAARAAWVDKVRAANAAKADAAKTAADRAEAARLAANAARAEAHAAWVEKVKAANAAKADMARAAAERAEAARLAANAARADAARAAAARAEEARTAAAAAKAARARGSRLSNDFLKGLADATAKTPATTTPGVVMSPIALRGINDLITRQIQPCANRQVNPGPGAERIVVTLRLFLNRDGSLAAPPRVVNHDGSSIDVGNRRYIDRVDDLAVAAFVGCAPLRGLPANLYDVPNGWRSISMRFRLPE